MMNIEVVDIKLVKANKDNPRIIRDENFEKLVESIRAFPEMLNIRPIVVNEEMVTLGGNMRLKACKAAGLDRVPIIRANNLTEDQQREFIIKDNVGYGEWDWDILANEWDADKLVEWGLDVWTDADESEVESEGRGDMLTKKVFVEMGGGDYREMLEVLNFWKQRGIYVGGKILGYLKSEKEKIS